MTTATGSTELPEVAKVLVVEDEMVLPMRAADVVSKPSTPMRRSPFRNRART